jgi:hypothetical protein
MSSKGDTSESNQAKKKYQELLEREETFTPISTDGLKNKTITSDSYATNQ